jgi:hypothetical protein
MLSVEVVLQWEELSLWVPHIPTGAFALQIGLDISPGVSKLIPLISPAYLFI